MKTDSKRPKDVDEYIAGFPSTVRTVLERVRRIIRKAVPGGEEVISYGIAAYRLKGRNILYFAGWKDHYSLYPATARLEAAFKDELEPYELSGRGTIRFPIAEPIPAKLIEKIARFRATEEPQRRKTKSVASKKRR